jgi:DNA-binding CsgD family transcriptional regulator
MVGTDDRRFTEWLELTADLVRCPGRAFPRTLISRKLSTTFGSTVAWSWMTGDGTWGFEAVNTRFDLLSPAHLDYWRGAGLSQRHPLVRWYRSSLDPTPMSIGDVPSAVVPRREVDRARAMLRPLEVDQQLSIPYRIGASEHVAFVMGRTGEDFHREEAALAARLQPLLCLAARQYVVLEESPGAWDVARDHGLTGREVAVLTLVAQNLTAVAIAHRLGISARTVHKHLEHVYAKLGVADRVTAVQVARRMGLCGTGTDGEAGGVASRHPNQRPM